MPAIPASPVTPAIIWRLRLKASAERVCAAWLNPADHVRFWCERSVRTNVGFRMEFIDGTLGECVVQSVDRPHRISFRYFGSLVSIHFDAADGGTDLLLEASDVPEEDWHDMHAGWLNVLLPFKSWVDYGIDLRNHDVQRTWRQGYVDQ